MMGVPAYLFYNSKGVILLKELIFIYDEPIESESFTLEQDDRLSSFNRAIINGSFGVLSNFIKPLSTSMAARNLSLAMTGANPISLILALAVTSGPLLYMLYKSKEKELSPSETKILESEINNLKITSEKARELKYSFPPGHPKSGVLYQRHPLANHIASKQLCYIPEQQYESILTEERQSELIRLLTELGATKIEILESSSNDNDLNSNASIKANSNTSALNASKKNDNNNDTNTHTKRYFKLLGKKWTSGQEFNTNSFNWLSFEPQWQSLVYTRSFGGCIEATIQMHEEQSLISGSELAMALKSNLSAALEGSSKSEFKSKHQKHYVIKIEFGTQETKI